MQDFMFEMLVVMFSIVFFFNLRKIKIGKPRLTELRC